MSEAKLQLVRSWLIKAHRDLAAARKLAADPVPYLDVAIYHCQQAAEKAVKGFLVHHDQRFEKTHDIRLLITLAASVETGFQSLQEAGEALTPYATAFRYPGEVLEPDHDEFDRALQVAEGPFAFVLSRLPVEVHP